MGRSPDLQHRQRVIDDWRTRLHIAGLPRRGRVTARDLLRALGLEAQATPPSPGPLRRAVQALNGIGAPATDGSEGPDPLDHWIVCYLVEPGEDLLVCETVRRRALARARDAGRRGQQGERGIHSATITMPAETWKRLEALRDELRARGDGEWTLGAVIKHVLKAYDAGLKPAASGHRKQTAPSRAQPDLPNAFAATTKPVDS